MKRDDTVYLRHILDAIARIASYVRGVSEKQFLAADMVQDAVVRQLEIIGEAARHLSPEFQTRHPELPWSQMTGLRNRIVHDYASIDAEIVWEVIKRDLPVLKKQIRSALQDAAQK